MCKEPVIYSTIYNHVFFINLCRTGKVVVGDGDGKNTHVSIVFFRTQTVQTLKYTDRHVSVYNAGS